MPTGPAHLADARAVARALTDRPLEYAIQPIRRFGPGWSRALRFEWLVRPQRHFGLSPNDLVTGVISLGLETTLDRRVAGDAIAFLGMTRGTSLAINILHSSAADPCFAHLLLETLDRHGVEPERLSVEITEHGRLSNLPGLLTTSETLRSFGIRIGLDDVGSGCHALVDSIDLDCLDYVKLDRRLISQAIHDPICRNQLIRLLHAARRRKLELVAEGIEHEQHVELALMLRIEVGQGYYWDLPRTIHCARPAASNAPEEYPPLAAAASSLPAAG